MAQRRSGKIKTGNIFLMLLIIGLVTYIFKGDDIKQQLEEWGISFPEEQVAPTPTPVEKKEVIKEAETVEAQHEKATSELHWNILTQYGDEFYIGKDNFIQIVSNDIDVKNITPFPKGTIELETIDRASGRYAVKTKKVGKVSISLMATVNKLTDVLGEKEFVVKRPPKDLPNPTDEAATEVTSNLLWTISTEKPDTLLAHQGNPIEIGIAETDPLWISPAISGEGNAILATDKKNGKYMATVTKGDEVTITVRVVKEGTVSTVGKKTFVVYQDPKSAPTPIEEKPIVSLSKPNAQTLYLSVFNPIQIETVNIPKEQLQIKSDKGIEYAINDEGLISVQPQQKGQYTLSVFMKKNGKSEKVSTHEFTVEYLPNPDVLLVNKSAGKIPIKQLKKATELTFKSPVEYGQIDYKVLSFSIRRYSNIQDDTPTIGYALNQGQKFDGSAIALLQEAKLGDLFYFTEIQIKGSDGLVRELPNAAFVAD